MKETRVFRTYMKRKLHHTDYVSILKQSYILDILTFIKINHIFQLNSNTHNLYCFQFNYFLFDLTFHSDACVWRWLLGWWCLLRLFPFICSCREHDVMNLFRCQVNNILIIIKSLSIVFSYVVCVCVCVW